jgi:hypothetical protein
VRGRNGTWARIEAVLVVLIALHSIGIGVGALLLPEWGVRFGGFGTASPLFFVRQVGVFHVVAAMAYLIEYDRYRGVAILLGTKTVAVLFLGAMMLTDHLPWVVPVSAIGDALMGIAAYVVHHKAHHR